MKKFWLLTFLLCVGISTLFVRCENGVVSNTKENFNYDWLPAELRAIYSTEEGDWTREYVERTEGFDKDFVLSILDPIWLEFWNEVMNASYTLTDLQGLKDVQVYYSSFDGENDTLAEARYNKFYALVDTMETALTSNGISYSIIKDDGAYRAIRTLTRFTMIIYNRGEANDSIWIAANLNNNTYTIDKTHQIGIYPSIHIPGYSYFAGYTYTFTFKDGATETYDYIVKL